MDLSDSEKRDLIKLIESNKPLPDQYRFRIFEKSDEIELLWNGKSNEITNVNLPFQIIEQVDEPRKDIQSSSQGNLFDERGRKLRGWTNKLIWGNNSLVLSSLINGPLREEIEKQGGLKLVYIDPPFNLGDDFEFEIEVGKEKLNKKRNALEQLAYSDTWGKGEDSFLSMIYERLKLIKMLMSNDASIYVHCDYRVSSYLRIILNEIFGEDNFKNELIWSYRIQGVGKKFWARKHDTIFFYTKSNVYNFKPEKEDVIYEKPFIDTKKIDCDLSKLTERNRKEIIDSINSNKALNPQFKNLIFDKYYNDVYVRDVWDSDYTKPLISGSTEYLRYPTQKPEGLMKRIINASSNDNDLVADFFSGSGSFIATAEKLNRKWIGCDLGKFAIHTSRKRLINVIREKEKEGQHFRPFEVLNLGKYQREFFVKDYLFNERNLKNLQAEEHYYKFILDAYKAKVVESLGVIKGIKNNRAIAVGPFNLQVTRLFVEEVIKECALKKIMNVDILGFEFEMGLFPNIRDVAAKQGVDLNCLYIPNDIFDKKAVKKHQIIFYNTAYIDAQIITKKDEFSVKLKGYSVFDSDNQFEEALSE